MKAIHLINRFEELDPIKLKGLNRVPGQKNVYRSCCWAFSDTEARSLIDGWIFLHPISKSEPSAFGGIIIAIERARREGAAIEDGYAFTFEAKKEGKGQAWRGAHHLMAWNSGIIDV